MRPPGNLILQPTLPKSGRILVAPIYSRRRLCGPHRLYSSRRMEYHGAELRR